MADLLNVRPAGVGVEIHGPFMPEHFVTLNGYRVPYVTALPTEDARVDICIDRRFGMEGPISREEFDRWMPILANAMAVAAGYSCHGENCGPINPFTTRMSSLGSINPKPELTVIEGDRPQS